MAGRALTCVALLRGINVGGKNPLPMKALAGLFERAGCTQVRTYIQSGNVVFQVPLANTGALPADVAVAIRKRHRLDVPVVLRTVEEMSSVVQGNPFPKDGADPGTLHVAFLDNEPPKANVAALDLARSPPDRFHLVGREIYLHCPNGFGQTKLTNQYFDSKLKTVSTVRNWRTVLTLLGMMTGTGD